MWWAVGLGLLCAAVASPRMRTVVWLGARRAFRRKPKVSFVETYASDDEDPPKRD